MQKSQKISSEQYFEGKKQFEDQLLTLKEAADLLGKSVHNIAYLISYKRIHKYNSAGKIAKKVGRGGIYVSKSELLEYWKNWKERLRNRMESLNITDDALAFHHISEKERTKHVHRLHPYLGKFIPQLVEHYVKANFTSKDILLDPFMGSGTTLAVSSELGIKSVGIDISEFNCTISTAKLEDYDLQKVENEITKIYHETENFSKQFDDNKFAKEYKVKTNSEYLNTWFAKRTLAELLFYRNSIKNYEYQDILKIILTRAARSSRLVHHYDIATPKKPVREPYVCRKHQDKICIPIDHAIGKIKLYSFDTIERLKKFSNLRKNKEFLILHGDSRYLNLKDIVKEKWGKNALINGIFTSPPYVGQIDYHDQHMYAYELFGIKRYDEKEIGAKKYGKGKNAQERYQEGISEVFRNVASVLSSKAKIFIVANDKFNLYPKIIKDSGFSQINVKERPVEARTEGDKTPYSEKIFECVLEY
ncbi:MAG: helix-turn-helix domain-containing protein [Nitrososphaeraceae archaeon]